MHCGLGPPACVPSCPTWPHASVYASDARCCVRARQSGLLAAADAVLTVPLFKHAVCTMRPMRRAAHSPRWRAHAHAFAAPSRPAAAGGRGLRVLLLLALLGLCIPARCVAQTNDTYSGYFKANTTAKAQALASAKATLNGLTLHWCVLGMRCGTRGSDAQPHAVPSAVYTILQNVSWAPENITYGDGFAYLVGFSSSPLVPLLRAGVPETSVGGPAGYRGFSLPAQPEQLDGASVWILKWVAAQANMTLKFDVVRLPGDVYYGNKATGIGSNNDTGAHVCWRAPGGACADTHACTSPASRFSLQPRAQSTCLTAWATTALRARCSSSRSGWNSCATSSATSRTASRL